jgi:tetratricopeptide (TPR) repeat protein
MALAHHYRILGLRTGASFADVKLAYRNLARLYHPDVNPGDQLAKEKFIQVTQAYQALAVALPSEVVVATVPSRSAAPPSRPQSAPQAKGAGVNGPGSKRPVPTPPVTRGSVAKGPAATLEFTVSPVLGGSEADQVLKVNGYRQLRELFQGQRFPRAVALVEGLVHRFPKDPEVCQWHAITYYRWGHDLLNHGNLAKAEVCLKKARRVDPLNKSLRQAVHKELQRLDYLRQTPMPQAQ